jgi:phage tail tape-measure protein
MVYDMGNSNPYDDGTHAAAGAVIGGVAGAIIGNNSGSHHNGWNSWSGAVVGAGLGAIVGSIADNNVARGRQQQAARQQLTEQQVQQAERARQTAPAAGQAPQNVTIINNYYGGASSMSPANSLFGR